MLEDLEREFQISSLFQGKLDQQFFELDLAEFGLPDAATLLAWTKEIEHRLGGVQGFRSKSMESTTYKGFSITCNPNLGPNPFATMGDTRLMAQNGFNAIKNSYHDTYRFSALHPIAGDCYETLLRCFSCQLTRSRVGYIYPKDDSIYRYNLHRDEFPYQNLRVNIPLQTSPEYMLEITGSDEYGNTLELERHLEVGKMYVWNTRLPHRVYAKSKPSSNLPRIHMVLGFMPWFNVNGEVATPNQFFGVQPFDLLKRGGLFK